MTTLIALIGVTAVGIGLFIVSRSRVANPASIAPFTPRTDNDKAIVVEGWNESELTKILGSFKKTYEKDGYPVWEFAIKQLSQHGFRVTFPQDIHPRLLIFLVNFLHYPFDFDLKDRVITAIGTSSLGDGFEDLDPEVGRRAMLYVPAGDDKYDVVYMETDKGLALANSFTDLRWRAVDNPRLPERAADLMGSLWANG